MIWHRLARVPAMWTHIAVRNARQSVESEHLPNRRAGSGRLVNALAAIVIVGALIALAAAGRASAQDAGDPWALMLDGRHVMLMRHALAPGTGDPADFDVDDCATQRNLSPAGRDQARRIGELLRARGVADADVRTSQWCRCRETAELLGIGEVRELKALNSFFRRVVNRPIQTRAVLDFVLSYTDDRPLFLVTHQVNITALTGVFPGSGDIVIARLNAEGKLSPVATVEALPVR